MKTTKAAGCGDCYQEPPVSRRRLLGLGAMLTGGLLVPFGTRARTGSAVAATASGQPRDFTPPQGCAYVGLPDERAPGFLVWRLQCGPNQNQARAHFGAALAAQGWMLCTFGMAQASWVKSGVLTTIYESSLAPGDFVLLSQRNAMSRDCGGPKHEPKHPK